MPQSNISNRLQFAIQQMAAESYLDGFAFSSASELIRRLEFGNNNSVVLGLANPGDAPDLLGKTRFVDLAGVPNAAQITGSAQAFVARYQIVHHHANDATGFSATLMRDTTTGQYTLSFRGTEYENQVDGGDWERDGLPGADGEIFFKGFAFGQLVSMEKYYQQLKADGWLPQGATLNVTGYSLGGHLATVFTELHAAEIQRTYTFNGAGHGKIAGGTPGLPEGARIAEMLEYFSDQMIGQGLGDQPFASGATGNLYTDSRYQTALQAVFSQHQPTSQALSDIPRSDGAFAQITQIVGHAAQGDTEYVANSGNHAAETSVYIEDQPDFDGFGGFFGTNGEYGTTHSIMLIVDSLALQELFQTLSPTLQPTQIEAIFTASSNDTATGTTVALSGSAEAKPLENALDALRRLFLTGPITETPSDPATGGFGNLANRNKFYEGIAAIKTSLAAATVTIEPFVELNAQGTAIIRLDPTQVTVAALENTDRGLAFRYALKNLNPFAVVGADYQALGHASNGALTLFDPATGFGDITEQYLADRAAFLEEKIELNLLNNEKSSGNIHFKDFAPNGVEITTTVDLRVDQEFLFGSDGDEGVGVLIGGSKGDHLYGGGGNDLLEGGDGRDYLQGDAGIDRLDGGGGADTMVGGADNDFYILDNRGDEVIEGFNNGTDRVESSVSFTLGANVEHLTLTGIEDLNGIGNELNNTITGNSGINRLNGQGGTDHLIGGNKNDILIGGTGDNDLLEGGEGFDTYIYNAGDGIDQIEDSDARGKIVFNSGLLQGGISTDGGATYVSLDGTESYILSGGHLIVNGVLTVNADFQSGQFGIQLDDLSNLPTNTGVPTGPFTFVVIGGANGEYFSGSLLPNGPEAYYGNGGDDGLNASISRLNYDDLLDGGSGDDTLAGGLGHDYLIGGEGADFGYLSDGDIFVGGDGNDIAVGDTDIFNFVVTNIGNGAYYADGGDGADTLLGALGVDVLHGGAGSDTLRGENRPAGWTARIVDFDGFYRDFSMAAYFSPTGAADVLFGEAGNDILVGDGGDDILSGGADNDQLFGDDEAGYLVVPGDDVLDGGAGDDLLAGGDGADSLSGGAGIDTLFGDKGDDVLDGGDDADTMLGGDGADELFGGGGNDLLFGDGLNNQFVADTVGGDDFLDGGDGDDELQGGVGADMLSGGAGNDFLLGQDDDDTIFGDEGDDELQGGDGIDLLGGDAGDDLLLGDAGDDELFGDTGDDQLGGNDGNDLLLGGAENDILEGGKGNDVLIGGAGNDVYNFSLGDGQDTITDTALAGEGNFINFFPGVTLNSLTFNHDQATQALTIQVGGGADSITLLGFDPNTFRYAVNALRFSDGSFVALADQLPLPGGLIEGTETGDSIATGVGDDTIFAGGGSDLVQSGAGNDQVIGGTGNDTLFGGAGQDTYFVHNGDGVDTITEATGEGNRVVFGAGVSPDALTLGTAPGGTLVINYGSIGNQVRLTSSLVSLPTIDTFQFADGTILTFAELVSRGIVIVGTAGNDFITAPDNQPYIIQGFGGDDVLFGGAGSDTVEGGAGSDVQRGGSGSDTLVGGEGNDSLEGEDGNDLLIGGTGDDQLLGGAGADVYQFNLGDGLDSISDPNAIGEESRVSFGPGITSSSITLTTTFGQVLVRPGATSDGLTIGANGSDVLGFRAVDMFEFADGTSLTYTDLVARGFDIDGTQFDDQLFGTNVADRITGGAGDDRLEGGEGDDRYFYNQGDGLDTINDQAVTGAGNAVVFGAGIASDAVQAKLVSSLFLEVGATGEGIRFDMFDPNDALGAHAVDRFEFAGGTTLTYSELLARGIKVTGTVADEELKGTNIGDRMDGLAGNDTLRGGEGSDVYLFGRGSGQDVVIDRKGTLDAVRFAADVAPADVTVTRNGHDLILGIAGATDRLTLSFFFLAPILQVEQVQFADGTVWDTTVLTTLASPVIRGTDEAESIQGTPNEDVILGFGGGDTITSLAGHDLLDGGTGTDQLTGGLGDDTYIVDDVGDVVTEAAEEGFDTIQSVVSRSLDAHVENVTLTGTAAINATGNVLDNVLTGNSAANVLSGGQGNDTYVVGADDTVVELAGEGIDTVETGTSLILGTNLENLTVTGSTSVSGTGNELNNVLRADGSISTLMGGAGDDTYMLGFNGDDDILVETATGGIDTVIAAYDYRLPAHIENLTVLDHPVPDFSHFDLSGEVLREGSALTTAGIGVGNDLSNVLIGGHSNNRLDGGRGVDTMIGGAGLDTYVVDNSADVVVERADEGVDTVEASTDYVLPAHVENLTLTGMASVTGTGNELRNDLRGNEASNVLDGGANNDSLLGAGGADTYLFGRGSGQDFVLDTSVAGEIDTVQLASNVALADVNVNQRGSDLVLGISGTPSELTLFSFFGSSVYAQKQVRFADGTIWSESELRARAISVGHSVTGTDANETLNGSTGHDVLVGNAGDDVLAGGHGSDWLYGDATFQSAFGPQVIGNDALSGGTGDDILIDTRGTNRFDGGSGNDSLFIGTGQDTVLFGRGSGSDTVHFDGNGSDLDIIEIAPDLTPDDMLLTRRYPNTNAMELIIRETGDTLTLNLSTNFPSVTGTTIQGKIVFADGTEWILTWAPPDPLQGTAGADVLTGSPGQALSGLNGDDHYVVNSTGLSIVEAAGEGIDTVHSRIDYTLGAHVENLTLVEVAGSVRGTGNELDNLIVGNTGDNILDGGAGHDVLVGGLFRSVEEFFVFDTGSDILIGGEGDDILMADGGNTVFPTDVGDTPDQRSGLPNTPDDVLIGGRGNDTYILNHAQESVVEAAGEGSDTVRSTVTYTLGDHVENLILVDPVFVVDDEDDIPDPVPLNGTGNELDNVLIGSGADNVLIGGVGNDTLSGGQAFDAETDTFRSGSDQLLGGFGHDTYLFNVGDGLDTIVDVTALGEGNRIQFGTGIGQSDLTFIHDETARTLTIQVGTSGTDQLLLTNFDPTGATGSMVVETLAFADGSTASLASLLGLGGPVATNGDDTITTGSGDDTVDALGGNDMVNTGAGNDTITGGTGNDQLIGGAGNDTYFFNPGDGVDTITDQAVPGEGNTLEFGTGVAPTDLSLGVGSLLIRVGATGDAIHLMNFDPGNVLSPRTIESFGFADGTVLSYDQLIARGFDLIGTAGHDTITGTNVVDRINGLAGDDTIQAGAGDDLLNGGAGGDTYLLNLGDGIDRIEDTSAVGVGNRIQFGTGISQAGLTFTHDEVVRTLTIDVGGSGADKLVLTHFDPTGANGSHVVETLAFADGSSVNLVDLYPPNHAPTVATPLADHTVPEDALFSIQVPANTFADQDANDVLTYSASLANGNALPSWLSFDVTTRTFSGTADDAQVGTLDLNVTATDSGNLSVSDVFTLAVTNVNEVPTVAMPLADQQATEDGSFNFVVPANIFADVDHVHGDQLAYRATLSDGSALPSWLNFDSATRTFSGMPLNGDVGILNIDITATDGGALSVTDSFALTVQNVNDAPTVAVPLSDQTAAEDSAFLFTVSSASFTDEDLIHGDVLTYSATLADGSVLPTWLGFDPATRTFSGTPGAGDAGTIHIEVTATDTEALSGTALFAVNVTRPLPQTVIGTTGNDVLTGDRGDDTLSGLAGHDLLDGDEGSDRMLGGAGSDIYVVDASGDVVTELPNEGFDTVIADITTALSANVEALVLTGSSAIDGTGNGLNNGLTGNNASNTLDGGSGADVMAGLDGDDTYIVDRSSDLAVELANHGIDTVQSAVTYALAANLEHLTLTGAAAINGMGNGLANVLVGNSAANRLTGGAGNDTYVVGAGDTVVESSNSGTDTVHSSVTWTLWSNLEHLTLTGSSAINGTGNSAANVLTGNSANNVLNGANGADTLRGGLGNDTVNGGGGNDTFLFGRSDGQDLVQDNSGAADKLLYEAGINPLDLVISRQANDLRLAIHGSPDQLTVQNWYTGTSNRIETLQAGNGQTLLSTQVDQLIQAMAGFTAQTGITWDQAIDQRPQEVQTVLAASWQ